MTRFFISAVLIFVGLCTVAQNINPGEDDIFRPDEVAEIRLTLLPADKDFFFDPENELSEEYKPAYFQMINSLINEELTIQVGVRLRGNTSRTHDKKAFKIDFREFGGSKFHDYKKFNLKSDVNDPSMVRELLTLKLYREMNVPAARTHHVKLYMNDEYMGIYLNVEQIDDEFLNDRFDHEEGFLYKCAYGASLEDNGQIYNESLFESELNEDDDTRAELDHFVEVLNGSHSASEAVSKYESVFEVDNYLVQLAVEAVLGHWDGYSYNMNNFYLFYNGETGRFQYFPYDADNTWGIDWVGRDWAKRNLNQWYNEGSRPLTKKLLAIPELKAKYIRYMGILFRSYFNEEYIVPLLDHYKEILDQPVEDDTYFDDAFDFTRADFLNSFYTGMVNNHVDYGLREYITVRTQYARDQIPALITATEEERTFDYAIYPNPSQNPYFKLCYPVRAQPILYSLSGQKMPLMLIDENDGCYRVEFSRPISKGLYIIEIDGVRRKWIYQ